MLGCFPIATFPLGSTLTVVSVNLQYGFPIADNTLSGWKSEPLWTKVDETIPSTLDYITSYNLPVNDECEMQLTAFGTPGSSNNHSLNFIYQKSNSDNTQIDLTISIYQGLTLIATRSYADIPFRWVQNSFLLTPGEVSNISDYTNLRVRFKANKP